MTLNILTPSRKTIIILLILIITFFMGHSKALAAGAYGWFATKADYADDNLSNCSDPVNQVSVQINLVKPGTRNTISAPIGSWSVTVRYKADESIKFTNTYSGEKQSDRICYNPDTEGIQVGVVENSNYFAYKGPTIFETSAQNSSIKGHSFIGYVELRPKAPSPSAPDIESVPVSQGFFASTASQELSINLNTLSTLFGNGDVRKVKFYIKKQDTPTSLTEIESLLSTPAGAGSSLVYQLTGSNALGNGHYLWSFNVEQNNSNTTYKNTPPAMNWTFSNIPASSVPNAEYFVVDTLAPISNIDAFSVTSINSSDPTLADLQLRLEVTDTLSGLDSVTLFVKDMTDNSIISVPYLGLPNPTPNLNNVVSLNNMVIGRDYEYYTVAVDRAGNSVESSHVTYTIPNSLTIPTIVFANPAYSGVVSDFARINTNVTNKFSNPVSLISAYPCWSTDQAKIDTLNDLTAYDTNNNGLLNIYDLGDGVICENQAGTGISWFNDPNNSSTNLSREITTMPYDTYIYYKVFAYNYFGWGHTTTGGLKTAAFGEGVATATNYIFEHNKVPLSNSDDISLGQVYVNAADYNAGVYAKAGVNLAVIDQTYDPTTGNRYTGNKVYPNSNVRSVNYIAKIDFGDNGTFDQTVTGSIATLKDTTASTYDGWSLKRINFTNVPEGTIKIEVTANYDDQFPCNLVDDPDCVDIRTETITVNLLSPGSLEDNATGNSNSTGELTDIDPQIFLEAVPKIIRKEGTADINWGLENIDISCVLTGPSGFSQTINPSTDGTLNSSTNRKEGTITSPPLLNTQIFTMTCSNSVSTYTATTRVTVLGELQEL
ncbi:MAG: hypothetical protein H6779_00180 [Candidatus Nomurabacteria bacterium]|nr:MAG: hypothetical protein H6779_00180 [Candidatus Nomurabacteria bacterium]